MGSKLLVTGGCGFVGAQYLRYVLSTRRPTEVVNLDRSDCDLTPDRRYRHVQGDDVLEEGFDAVVHFDTESVIPRTQKLLEAARSHGVSRFLQVSTGDVYGPGTADESAPLEPADVDSAMRAGADLLALAQAHSFGLEVVVVRASNPYGPGQPAGGFVSRCMAGGEFEVSDAVRDWIFVHDLARGIQLALEKGRPGSIYNLGGEACADLDVARTVLKILGRPESEIRRVAGGGRRVLDSTRAARELDFRPSLPLQVGLKTTVEAPA